MTPWMQEARVDKKENDLPRDRLNVHRLVFTPIRYWSTELASDYPCSIDLLASDSFNLSPPIVLFCVYTFDFLQRPHR